MLAEALIAGLCAAGVTVRHIGQVASPHLYHAVVHGELGGGVMVTGSHNPPEYNGFKIMVGSGSLHGDGIQRLYERIQTNDFHHPDQAGEVQPFDAITPYERDVLERLSPLSRPLKVVVDAGNGCGGLAVPVLRAQGAEVIELFCEADATFPNHHPDPTVEHNLIDLKAAVAEHQADVGIADGDVDRIGAVDERGQVIWGDLLTLLFARAILSERPGAAIIGEVKCSKLLYDGIAEAGGDPVMWKAGHSLIKAKMKETGALLAGEMSGHIFFADRFYGFDDAIYAAGRLLERSPRRDRPLSAHLAGLPGLYSTPEIRRGVPAKSKFARLRRRLSTSALTIPSTTSTGASTLVTRGAWCAPPTLSRSSCSASRRRARSASRPFNPSLSASWSLWRRRSELARYRPRGDVASRRRLPA